MKWWRRDAAIFALVLVAIAAASRVFGAVLLGQLLPRLDFFDLTYLQVENEPGLADISSSWDGQWYRRIAAEGYPQEVPRDASGLSQQNALAFYPLYPLLVRGLMTVSGWKFSVAGIVVSLVASTLALVLLGFFLRKILSPVAAVLVVAILSTSPPAITFGMTYSEGLALLLLVVLLVALRKRQWWWVVSVLVLVGLSRPVGVPLVLVVAAAIFWRWRQQVQRGKPIAQWEWLGMLAAGFTSLLAGWIWPACTAAWTGQVDAYTDTMAAWRANHELIYFWPWWQNLSYVISPGVLVWLLPAGIIGFFVAVLGPWARGLGVELRVWSAAYGAYLLAVLDVWTSTWRYLLFFFPLIAVFIGAAWRQRDSRSLVSVRVQIALAVLWVAGNLWASTWWVQLVLVHGGYPI